LIAFLSNHSVKKKEVDGLITDKLCISFCDTGIYADDINTSSGALYESLCGRYVVIAVELTKLLLLVITLKTSGCGTQMHFYDS
jgi:hypothetical protein